MRITHATLIAAVLVLICAGLGLWAWFALPAGVPVNYLTLDGRRHLGASRQVFLVIPSIACLLTCAFAWFPSLGFGRDVERAEQPFDMTVIGLAGLLLVVEALLVGRAMDPAFDVLRPTAIATGVLLAGIGNYLGKARQNAVFGLRTPWTLADPNVWDRTHRFTGAAMMAGALVLIALGFVLHEGVALGLAIGACTALPLLGGVARSASLYRGRPQS
jgi:uncharacterized membrane protein